METRFSNELTRLRGEIIAAIKSYLKVGNKIITFQETKPYYVSYIYDDDDNPKGTALREITKISLDDEGELKIINDLEEEIYESEMSVSELAYLLEDIS